MAQDAATPTHTPTNVEALQTALAALTADDAATPTPTNVEALQTALAALTADDTATPTATATSVSTAPTRTTVPTRTPRPTRTPVPTNTPDPDATPAPATATPRASATPVHIEKVAVTAVEGATTVEPDAQVELMAGNVSVKFPALSRSRTYQAMLSESDDCGDMAVACAMVSIYNAEGEMESDVRLISAAEITITLDADAVAALGGDLDGGAVALQAHALGGIMLQVMDDASGEWNSIPFDFNVNEDGSVTVSAMTRRFSTIALNVYADVVEQARMQLSAALGTPTATPIPTATPVPPTPVPPTPVPPTPVPPTPVPPTPVPPTPVPPTPMPPDPGDASVPSVMLIFMLLAGSMLAFVGAKVITGRIRR